MSVISPAPARHCGRRPYLGRRRLAGLLATIIIGATAGTVATSSPAEAIIGGVSAPWWIYPFTVRYHDALGMCTGTVIAPDTVLTAAHCVASDGILHGNESVQFADGSAAGVVAIRVHPLWNGDASTAMTSPSSRPLPARRLVYRRSKSALPGIPELYTPGRPATLVGLGITQPGGAPPPSEQLRAVDTIVRSDSDMHNSIYDWHDAVLIGAGTNTATTCNGVGLRR